MDGPLTELKKNQLYSPLTGVQKFRVFLQFKVKNFRGKYLSNTNVEWKYVKINKSANRNNNTGWKFSEKLLKFTASLLER